MMFDLCFELEDVHLQSSSVLLMINRKGCWHIPCSILQHIRQPPMIVCDDLVGREAIRAARL